MNDFEIKGARLTMEDMMIVKKHYDAACTAEYLMENYPALILDEEYAMQLGYEVRNCMDKYSLSEEDAIYSVLFGDKR